jgi:hypothetical protein
MVKIVYTESSKGKIKIAVDENINGLVPLLKENGYNVLSPEKGMTDSQVCKWLHSNNVKAFFTCNYIHFTKKDCTIQSCIIFGLQGWDLEFTAELIEKVMQNSFSDIVQAKISMPDIINEPLIIGHDNYKSYMKGVKFRKT